MYIFTTSARNQHWRDSVLSVRGLSSLSVRLLGAKPSALVRFLVTVTKDLAKAALSQKCEVAEHSASAVGKQREMDTGTCSHSLFSPV